MLLHISKEHLPLNISSVESSQNSSGELYCGISRAVFSTLVLEHFTFETQYTVRTSRAKPSPVEVNLPCDCPDDRTGCQDNIQVGQSLVICHRFYDRTRDASSIRDVFQTISPRIWLCSPDRYAIGSGRNGINGAEAGDTGCISSVTKDSQPYDIQDEFRSNFIYRRKNVKIPSVLTNMNGFVFNIDKDIIISFRGLKPSCDEGDRIDALRRNRVEIQMPRYRQTGQLIIETGTASISSPKRINPELSIFQCNKYFMNSVNTTINPMTYSRLCNVQLEFDNCVDCVVNSFNLIFSETINHKNDFPGISFVCHMFKWKTNKREMRNETFISQNQRRGRLILVTVDKGLTTV
ncbi:hypothetical protein WN51_11838 [Melipona quadrifasciata]|uniref:Uncharacterized protein n=1 Tax=Melipona quadrifasciata TaxID=166423 RepID=A0A0M9A536_9HYME|nr:hypothetical protein WN51_11838 [Melipona quadrifasciata]